MQLTYKPENQSVECIDTIINALKKKNFNCNKHDCIKAKHPITIIYIHLSNDTNIHEIIGISILISSLDY